MATIKDSQKSLNGRPMLALVRSDTEEMKKRFPDSVELYRNVGRGPAFGVFTLIYEFNTFFASDPKDCMAVLNVGDYFSVKYIPNTVPKEDVLKTYKNLNDEILSKMETCGHDYVGIVFYKDSSDIWHYSLYIGKGAKREILGYGLLSEFFIDS